MRIPMFAGAAAPALSFAHMAGLVPGKKAKAAKADEQDDKKAPGAEDPDKDESAEDPDDSDKNMAADEPDDGDDEDDKPEASAADGDDEDEDDDEPPKSKKAKGQGGRRPLTADFKRGRRAERRRCAAIFGHAAAAKNPALACHLAFNTGMASAHAIDVLQKTPAAAGPGGGREARNPRIGPDAGRPDQKQQAASAWDHAHAKASGRPAKAETGPSWDSAHRAAQR